MKIQRILFILVAAIVVQSCATTYVGPRPNLTLKGEEAKQEYARFRLHDSFMGQRPEAFQVGADYKLYTSESFKPVIFDVSPRAYDKLQTAQTWRAVQHVFMGAMIATLVVALTKDFTTTTNIFFYSSAGLSITAGIVASAETAKACGFYNEDLRSRLGIARATGPQLNYAFQF